MWSWHLWFTTSATTYPTSAIASTYKFAPDNIGTVHTGRISVYGKIEKAVGNIQTIAEDTKKIVDDRL